MYHAILGGVFVVCLMLLVFLLNGGGTILSAISAGFSQYARVIEVTMAYIAIAGFATFAIKFEGISWKQIGITRRNFTLSLPVLFSLGVATTLVAWIGHKWPQMAESTQTGMVLPLPSVIALVFAAAVVEEYIFRGYVQVGTRKHFGVTAGLIVSAGVFTIAHIPTDLTTMNIISNSSLIAAVPSLAFSAVSRFSFSVMALAGMYELTGNIFITVFTHSFYDFSVVYYPPVGGNLTVVLVCLILPFVVVFLTQYHRGNIPTQTANPSGKYSTIAAKGSTKHPIEISNTIKYCCKVYMIIQGFIDRSLRKSAELSDRI